MSLSSLQFSNLQNFLPALILTDGLGSYFTEEEVNQKHTSSISYHYIPAPANIWTRVLCFSYCYHEQAVHVSKISFPS